jgi:hypothetical protein
MRLDYVEVGEDCISDDIPGRKTNRITFVDVSRTTFTGK